MANYVITNGSSAATPITASTTYEGVLRSVAGATARRGKLYDILVGTAGTPADNAMEFQVARCTTGTTNVGGGTLTTVQPLDPADAAALTVTVINASQTPTISAVNVWYIGMNQRASYRWVCAPGSEIVWPATTSNGVTLEGRSAAYTGSLTGTWMFQEQ